MENTAKKTKRLLILAAIFFIAFGIGLCVYDELKLPFSNPWSITGPLSVLKYNANNDIIRFLFLITLPSIAFIMCSLNKFTRDVCITEMPVIYGFKNVENNKGLWKTLVYLLVFSALVVEAGGTYRSQPLDTFHEGETLGPAIDYLNGRVPYRDTIFIHGAFRDPLRSVLAFKMFGRSIGALRTLTSLTSILTLALFFVALYLLYARNIYYTAVSVFSFMIVGHIRPFGVTLSLAHVGIPFLMFVIVAVLVESAVRNNRLRHDKTKTYILLFLFTFVPTLSFAYSIDRGFYLSAACIVYSLAMYLCYLKKIEFQYTLSMLGGYIFGIVGLGFAIRWAYYDFAKYTFLILPKYEPLMNGFIYPFRKVQFLLPVFVISISLYWLILRFVSAITVNKSSFSEKAKEFYTNYFIEILLLMLSIFYFRRVLIRSDLAHLAGGLHPIVILTTYILFKHYVLPLLSRTKHKHRFVSTAAVAAVVFFMVLSTPRVNWGKWYKFPLDIPDREFVPENYFETISFLKKNLNADEDFVTMTSEASWYYFVNRPCPIRFQVIYQAMPYFYQNEIVEDFKKSNVKYILYNNSHWANTIEGFDNGVRLPIVFEYIAQEYVFYKRIDDNEIWIRKAA